MKIAKQIRKSIIYFIAATLWTLSAHAQTSVYDDPRIETWSNMMLAGEYEDLLLALEEDLYSDDTHPLAHQAWVRIIEAKTAKPFHITWALLSDDLKQAVGVTGDIEAMISEGRHLEVLGLYPPHKVPDTASHFIFKELEDSAELYARYDLADDYNLAALKRWPDSYQYAWDLTFGSWPKERQEKWRKALEENPEWGALPLGELISFRVDHLGNKSMLAPDRRRLLQKWRQVYPKDARAAAAHGFSARTLYRYEEAKASFEDGYRLYPFYSNFDAYTSELVRSGNVDSAQVFLRHRAELFGKDGVPNEDRINRWISNAYRSVGRYKSARDELAKVADRGLHPKDSNYYVSLSGIEQVSNRTRERAEALEKGLALDPDNSDGWYDLAYVYIDLSELDKAETALANFKASTSAPTVNMVWLEARLLSAQKSPDHVLFLEDATRQFTLSELIWTSYGNALKEGQSLPQLRARVVASEQAFRLTESKANLDNLQDAVRTLATAETPRTVDTTMSEWIDELNAEHPGQNAILAAKAELMGLKGEVLANFWEEAVQAFPDNRLIWESWIELASGEKEWPLALERAELMLAHAEKATKSKIGFYTDATLFKAWTMRQGLEKAKFPSGFGEELLLAIKPLQEYGSLSAHLEYKRAGFRALGRSREEAEAVLERAKLLPFDRPNFGLLYARSYEGFSKTKAWTYGLHMITEQPYNEDFISDYVHAHVMWGGSPVVGLWALHQARSRGLNINRNESDALSQLGDPVTNYNNKYRNEFYGIGTAERYIGWYDREVKKIMTGGQNTLTYHFDEDTAAVEVHKPNGEVIYREDSITLGKVTRLARGPYEIEILYNERGEFAGVKDAKGEILSLTYSEDNTISALITEDDTITFEYNDNRKPIVIASEKSGTIEVTYFDSGEIKSVDSEDGHSTSLAVTQSFQKLLAITNEVGQLGSTLDIPRLSIERNTSQHDILYEAMSSYSSDWNWSPDYADKKYRTTVLELIDYNRENLGENGDYLPEALSLLERIINAGTDRNAAIDLQAVAAQQIPIWQSLKQLEKPNGVLTEEYSWWREKHKWLSQKTRVDGAEVFRTALADVNEKGLSLLEVERWLPANDLSNDARWSRTDIRLLLPAALRQTELHTSIQRSNGDLVVGTSSGLLVHAGERWRWYGFDTVVQAFSETTSHTSITSLNEVTALQEDALGRLWIGTNEGLLRLDGEAYTDKPAHRWQTQQDGLPNPIVTGLALSYDKVVIGTASGLVYAEDNVLTPIEALADMDISQLTSLYPERDGTLVYTNFALYLIEQIDTEPRLLLDEKIDQAAYLHDTNELLILQAGKLSLAQLEQYGSLDLNPAPGQAAIPADSKLTGVMRISLPPDEQSYGYTSSAIAVQTDAGVAFYRDWHFEFMPLPLKHERSGQTVGPAFVIPTAAGPWFATGEGIYRFNATLGRAYNVEATDLLTSEKHGLTLIAGGRDDLLMFDHETGSIRTVEYISADKLAVIDEDTVLTNDGSTVVSVDLNTLSARNLFRTDPKRAEDGGWGQHARITDILISQAGDVWVISGSSVYQYNPGTEEKTEYNYLVDPERFPAASDKLSHLFETSDGTIWVSVSEESFNSYKGVDLFGGLFKFDSTKFVKSDKDFGRYTLVSGVTHMEDKSTLLGTSYGFIRTKINESGALERIRLGGSQKSGDAADRGLSTSYDQLQTRRRMWLGGDGKQYDADAYLLPTTDGVALLYHNQWFMLDRLNQLLPDDVKFGQYGGRGVLALEVDSAGRIYVATKRGLAIFHPAGGLSELMLMNGMSNDLFAFREADKLAKVSTEFLGHIDPNSRPGQLVQEIQDIDRKKGDLQQIVAASETDRLETSSSAASEREEISASPAQARDKRASELARLDRQRLNALSELEENHRGLFQMLQVDPRELAGLNDRLDDNAVVVQYVPAGDTLFIQLTAKDKPVTSVQVPVKTADLNTISASVNAELERRARLINARAGGPVAASEMPQELTSNSLLIDELAWLYDHLLRPVEANLKDYDNIMLAPYSQLMKVPFDALVRKRGDRIEFAVESFDFNTLTSLYMLNLIIDEHGGGAENALLIGNPDNTLPFAEKEVEAIAPYFDDNTMLVGRQAKLDAVRSEMPKHGVLHFATHGKLDPEAPRRSYLTMANKERLNIIDVSIMDLGQASIAVLSACETARGSSGLEYVTLARAFAHARVPSTVASLWSVDDEATQDLMAGFYRYLDAGTSPSTALAKAKRDMIAATTSAPAPEAWSGFVLFGKP